METFNSNSLVKSLKKGYDLIPVLQGDKAAKILVADSIKANSFSKEDVIDFLFKEMNHSGSLTSTDWDNLIAKTIKTDSPVGQNLKVLNKTLKSTFSSEEIFNMAASGCGKNPEYMKDEIYLDMYGWGKVVDTLLKTKVEEYEEKDEPKVVTKEEKKTVSKAPIKAAKRDPRSKPITLINEKTGEIKTWESYRDCEKELYNDSKLGHGTVSQLVKGYKGCRHIKGVWALYKGKKLVEKPRRSKSKMVTQCFPDGSSKVWSSLSEAAKATGISHSSISKAISGTYQSAGGFTWKAIEAAA